MATNTQNRNGTGGTENLRRKVATVSVPPVHKFKRTSEPKNWTPYSLGGAGIVAKRVTQDPLFVNTSNQLQSAATSKPMQLLALLPSIHPSVGLALWNTLRLTCPPGGIKLKAYKKDKRGKFTKPDDKATHRLDEFFEQLPNEIGGAVGLQTTLTIQALFTGLICTECVPSDKLQGLRRVWPVDSLSIMFIKPTQDADQEPFQHQIYPTSRYGGYLSLPKVSSAYTSNDPFDKLVSRWAGLNYKHLNKETFFWRAIDSNVDDPYGTAPYATCLNEVLADIALMQDLRDSVHNAAWPRLEVGVDTTNLHKVAVEVYKITNPVKAAEWVQARFNEIVDYISDLEASDNIVHESSGTVKNIQPGSFQGMDSVLNFLRQRICQALKTLPTLLGINDGSTFNYTSVEWAIYAAGLETLRAIVAEVMVKIANLHLRLLGLPVKVKATYEPIRTNDALVEANTKNVEIQNMMLLFDREFIDASEASLKVCGHEPSGKPKPRDIEQEALKQKQAGQGDNVNKTGMTPEERRNTGG